MSRLRAWLMAYDKGILLRYPLLWETRAHFLIPACLMAFSAISALIFAWAPVSEQSLPSCSSIFSMALAASSLAWLAWLLKVFPNALAREVQRGFGGWSRSLWWFCCTAVIFALPTMTTWALHLKIQQTLDRDQVLADFYTSSALQVVLAHLQEGNQPSWVKEFSENERKSISRKYAPFLNVEEAWRAFSLRAGGLSKRDQAYLGLHPGSPEEMLVTSFRQLDPQQDKQHPHCKVRIAALEAMADSFLKLRVSWNCFSSHGPSLAEAQLEALDAYIRIRNRYVSWPNDPKLILEYGSARERWSSILYSFNLIAADDLGSHSFHYPLVASLIMVLIGFQGFFTLRLRLVTLAMSFGLSWALTSFSVFLSGPIDWSRGTMGAAFVSYLLLLSALTSLITIWSRIRSLAATVAMFTLFMNIGQCLMALAVFFYGNGASNAKLFPSLHLIGLTSLTFLLFCPLLQWLLNHYFSLPER